MEQFDEERCGNLTWEYHEVSGAARRDLTKQKTYLFYFQSKMLVIFIYLNELFEVNKISEFINSQQHNDFHCSLIVKIFMLNSVCSY